MLTQDGTIMGTEAYCEELNRAEGLENNLNDTVLYTIVDARVEGPTTPVTYGVLLEYLMGSTHTFAFDTIGDGQDGLYSSDSCIAKSIED